MTALLWLTHVWTPELQAEFEGLLALAGPEMPQVWLLLDARTPEASALAARYPRCHVFSDETLRRLPYPRLHDRGTRGHCHFPVLDFHRAHPDYEHYWVVEYDVRYTGAWRSLLASFAGDPHDLITCHLRSYAEEPRFFWWPTFGHPTKSIPRDRWWRSFNVIFRVSSRALVYLDEALTDGWRGHAEVILPTLLLDGGFEVRDLGGDGHFVPAGQTNRIYTCRSTPSGNLSPFETVSFRPARARAGWRRNKIYHPVKPRALREPVRARWQWMKRYLRDVLRNGHSR